MAKLFFFTLLTVFISLDAYSLEVKASLWTKTICGPDKLCLPQALGEPQQFEIPEPANNSFSRYQTVFEGHTVTFTYTKRTDPNPYYSFQVEIGNQTHKTLALCSRYEALNTVENAMVGACAGKIPNKNKLIGVSMQIPN